MSGSGVSHLLEVHGDFACFSRPELSVERFSYPCPTPGAARGIFEAIYFKPQFRWQVEQIELLSPPSYIGLRRNEVKDKASEAAVKKWMAGTEEPEPLFADADKSQTGSDFKGRTQRQTMALRNPRFRLTARVVPRPGFEQEQKAYDEQFRRRASQGKCFVQPCLGMKEVVAFFKYLSDTTNLAPPVDYSQDLGFMVYDVFDLADDNYYQRDVETRAVKLDKKSQEPVRRDWKSVGPSIAVFQAKIDHGVLIVPPYESDLVLKPERRAG
jgi:CRISPR-associated protein Cas5d